jgi:ABC-type transport system involved in multi-copper enzyme maturation permease subunit
MTTTVYRSVRPTGRDGFGQLLRGEWTKLRTVRGWVFTIFLAAALTAAVPIFLASTAKSNDPVTCAHGTCQAEGQTIAAGPGGEAVIDSFYFARQPLATNGSITARVSGLHGVGRLQIPPGFPSAPSTMPWAKAGLIIKASTRPGAAYAAVMLTGGHGVRMQYDFTRDMAGISGASAQWLRLTRSGDVVTGYESTAGRQWTKIGTAIVPGLTATAQAGLFVASPTFQEAVGSGDDSLDVGTQASASFSHIALSGGQPGAHWTGTQVGPANVGGKIKLALNPHQAVIKRVPQAGSARATAGTITVAGSGDIAPFEAIVDPMHVVFFGTFFGLIALIALGALFVTAEYRRGLMRTTVTASPRRGRILVAKSIVIGLVAFLAGLVGGAIALPIASHKLYANDWRPPVWPELSLTSGIGLRIVLGTAAIAAVGTVLGLAAGAIFRRGTGAIVATTGVVIVPLILALVMPLTLATWLLRLSPAAAFSLQSSVQRYPQVSNVCAPYHSCFPLSPWHGFAVLCAWAAVALGVAIYALRRRDV